MPSQTMLAELFDSPEAAGRLAEVELDLATGAALVDGERYWPARTEIVYGKPASEIRLYAESGFGPEGAGGVMTWAGRRQPPRGA